MNEQTLKEFQQEKKSFIAGLAAQIELIDFHELQKHSDKKTTAEMLLSLMIIHCEELIETIK